MAETFFFISCHGSLETFQIDVSHMVEKGVHDALVKFAFSAFQDEAKYPDLRELIAYNKGQLPKALNAVQR